MFIKRRSELRICSVYCQTEILHSKNQINLYKFNFKYNVSSLFCNAYILRIFKVKLFYTSYNTVKKTLIRVYALAFSALFSYK